MQSDPSKQQRTTEDDILLTHALSLNVERDKQLLTLSAAGMGLLGTLLAAKGTGSIAEIAVCFGGILCFVLAIGCLLYAFSLNKDFTEKTMEYGAASDEVVRSSDFLAKTQQVGAILFFIGAFLSAVFTLVTASNSFESAQQEKTKKEQITASDKSDQKLLDINKSISVLQNKMISIEEHLRSKSSTSSGRADANAVNGKEIEN